MGGRHFGLALERYELVTSCPAKGGAAPCRLLLIWPIGGSSVGGRLWSSQLLVRWADAINDVSGCSPPNS